MVDNNLRPHVVLENKHNGMHAIKLTEDPYSGIIFSYGRVWFDDDSDVTLKINFDYDVHDSNGIDYDTVEFETYLSGFLQELILYGIHNNDLTYTGGVDENRAGDFNEPDFQ